MAAKNFLHARLLVDEILAEPDYLDPELLGELLQLELPGLFDVMLGRLKRLNPAFIPPSRRAPFLRAAGCRWLTTSG